MKPIQLPDIPKDQLTPERVGEIFRNSRKPVFVAYTGPSRGIKNCDHLLRRLSHGSRGGRWGFVCINSPDEAPSYVSEESPADSIEKAILGRKEVSLYKSLSEMLFQPDKLPKGFELIDLTKPRLLFAGENSGKSEFQHPDSAPQNLPKLGSEDAEPIDLRDLCRKAAHGWRSAVERLYGEEGLVAYQGKLIDTIRGCGANTISSTPASKLPSLLFGLINEWNSCIHKADPLPDLKGPNKKKARKVAQAPGLAAPYGVKDALLKDTIEFLKKHQASNLQHLSEARKLIPDEHINPETKEEIDTIAKLLDRAADLNLP